MRDSEGLVLVRSVGGTVKAWYSPYTYVVAELSCQFLLATTLQQIPQDVCRAEVLSKSPLLSSSIMCVHSWLAASACNILSQLTAAQQTQTYLSQCPSATVDSCSTNKNIPVTVDSCSTNTNIPVTVSQLTATQQTQTYLSQCHS